MPATCNPDGAPEPGQRPKWRFEYSETLRGADIVIIPDHDAQGYAHADAIANMSAGVAKRVRILKLAEHWAECPHGGDVSDWLAAGHRREELDALIAQAKPWTPSDDGSDAKHEQARGAGLQLEDFVAYMPQHSYIFVPSRETVASGERQRARAACPRPRWQADQGRATWLDANAAVEQMTWAPGEPMLIKDRLISDGGWIERPGCSIFNLYRPPLLVPNAGDVTPWLDHVHKVYPRRGRAHHPVAGAPGAAAGREDQPRAGARRQAGHRQGHDPGAGEAGGRAVEFRRRVADSRCSAASTAS